MAAVIILILQDAGVPFIVEGKIHYLQGTLTIASADNPASNLMGGYKSLTSAFRKCRTCMAVATDMQTKVTNENTELCTIPILSFYSHIKTIML